MTYDSTELNLTREKALELHRQMWMEMQEKLGDCPSAKDRDKFKANWCAEHFPNHSILNDCFLCDYVHHDFAATTYCLTRCPIDWESLKKYSYQTTDCCAVYKEYDGDDDDEENEIHYTAPISEILALPEREVKE